MPDPQPRSGSRWSRPRVLALATVVLAAVAGGWLLWPGDDAIREPATAQAPVLPPSPDRHPAAPPVPAPDTPATAAAPDDDAEEPLAGEPPLLSDNTNLSFARRAGLHRAPNPLNLTASVALVVDTASGEVLYARNEHAILPIASLTKLLTAIVLLDSKVPLSQSIRISRDDVDTLRHSRSRLRVGTTLTRREALRLALMSSENRAAHALARTFPGGTEAFVAAMNRKAAELGMEHSTFVDPTGLSNGNRSTGLDVATLVAAAAKYPLVRRYSTTERRQVTFGKRRLQYLNSNRLVRHTDWPFVVQKTGYIVEAGQCVAMATRTAGRTVTLVVMDAGSVTTRSRDLRKMRKWATRELAQTTAGR